MPLGTLVFALALLPSMGGERQKLDFESKACNVGQLVEKFSVASGLKLRAASSLAQEIVFVQAHDVKPEELKAKIAEALEASWVKKSDAEYLDRTPAQEKAIWNRHIALRRKFVDEELAKKRKELTEPFDAQSLASGLVNLKSEEEVRGNQAGGRARYEREQLLFSQAPLARLLHRLVLACDPNDLAAIGPYERRIFKLSPTLMQKGIERKKYEAALATFASEQQAWIDVAEKTVFPENTEGRMVSDPRAQLRHSPDLQGVALEIRRGDMTALFNVNLIGERAQGFGRGVLTQAMYADPARRFLNLQGVPSVPPDNDPPVELSKEFQTIFVEAMGGGARAALNKRMTEVLLNPDKFEPLGFASSDVLKSYAELRKRNIVAALSDHVFTLTYYLSGQQGTRTNQFIQGLVSSGTIDLRESDGWAIFAPADRYEAALEFTPRAPITELMIAVATKGRLELRDFAKYAFKSGRITRMGIGDLYLAMWDRSVLSTFDRTDWNGLRLYGSFTADQQRALEDGARFPLLGLNAAQKRIVERIVYAGEIQSDEYIDANTRRMNIQKAVEPTEQFAGGLPPGGAVLARVKSLPILVAYGQKAGEKPRPQRSASPYTIAHIETDVVGNPSRMREYGVEGLVGYAPAHEKLISLRVELAPGLWKETSMSVTETDPNATPVTWDKLPEPFRKQIADLIDQYKKSKAAVKPTVPPPH